MSLFIVNPVCRPERGWSGKILCDAIAHDDFSKEALNAILNIHNINQLSYIIFEIGSFSFLKTKPHPKLHNDVNINAKERLLHN